MGTRAIILATALLPAIACAQDGAVFGAWERICTPDATCYLSQVNQRPETGETVMRTDVAPVDGGGVIVAVRVPSAVSVTEGPWLTVEGVYIGELTYQHCASGCVASATLPAGLAAALTSDGNAVVTLVTLEGARVGVPILLDGLGAGLSATP